MSDEECVSCGNLIEAIEKVCGRLEGYCLYDISVAWIVSREGPLGRITISRRLGVSERRVRASIERLRGRDVVAVDPVAGVYALDVPRLLKMLECIDVSEFRIAVLNNPCTDLTDLVEKHVVSIRDRILITFSSNPLEVIGYIVSGVFRAPYVPEHMLEKYKHATEELTGDALLVFMKRGTPLYYCPGLLLVLASTCLEASSSE